MELKTLHLSLGKFRLCCKKELKYSNEIVVVVVEKKSSSTTYTTCSQVLSACIYRFCIVIIFDCHDYVHS